MNQGSNINSEFVALREYQKQCVLRMLWGMTLDGNDLISIPTGGGKTIIIAEFVNRLNKPILILVPSKELLEQDLQKLSKFVDKKDIGVFSASMNSKEVKKYTLATIQSAYRCPEKFAHYEVVIIDEADLLNPKNLAGMYNTFFQAIGNPKVIGLTATPFRMDHFYRPINATLVYRSRIPKWATMETVHTLKFLTRYKERFWSRVLYVVQTEDLIKENYLCRLTYHDMSMIDQNDLKFNKSKSDFDMEDFNNKFDPFLEKTAELVNKIESKSIIIFCANITQAESLKKLIGSSVVITSGTKKKDRERIVNGFKSGSIRVVINVGILLVGFDKPDLDTIIVARPTRSLRLHSQMLGRGTRIAVDKSTCHIYDLVGNVKTLGTLESMKIVKIDNKWNVITNTRPEGWHYAELYSHKILK